MHKRKGDDEGEANSQHENLSISIYTKPLLVHIVKLIKKRGHREKSVCCL